MARPKGNRPFAVPPRFVAPTAGPRPTASMGWDARYESDKAAANRDFEYGQNNLALQRTQTENSFGFNDPTNPFSQAALLQKSYEATKRGTLNNLASQGQLYSGAMNNARYQDANAFAGNYNDLRTAYEQALSDNTAQGAELAKQRDDSLRQAETDRLERALSAPVDSSTAFAGYTTADPNKIRTRMAWLNTNRNKLANPVYRRRRANLMNRYNASVEERRSNPQ